jgi:putative acetyltransferase
LLIRRYAAHDRDTVRAIHGKAFDRSDLAGAAPPEVTLLDALIDADDVIAPLSLVAVREDEIVGHVVCSRATVDAHQVAGLGPIAVLPEHQRSGVGLAMVHAVLGAADALELPLVGLLGSPVYYSRYGFVPSAPLGIDPPDPAWGDHFQVRTLAAYRPAITGRFRYAPAFDAV